jgi:hypothetical protein
MYVIKCKRSVCRVRSAMKEEEDVLKSDEEDSRCIIGNMYICI